MKWGRKLVFKELAEKEVSYVDSPTGARFRLDDEGEFTNEPILNLEGEIINSITFSTWFAKIVIYRLVKLLKKGSDK